MIIALVVLAALLLVLFLNRGSVQPSTLENGVPEEFQGGRVVMNEAYISTNFPIPLTGRVDQVFSRQDNVNVIVDTKKRSRIAWYKDDQLQISVYALILASKGMKIALYGYIRIPVTETKSIYVKVPLLPAEKVIAYYHLYWDLKDGHVAATCTCGRH